MRSVIVETNLGQEADWNGQPATLHARTRFIDRPPEPSTREPQLGDRWDPLTVRARLQRTAEVFRKLPHTPDTRPGGHRSCMPTPVRELFKDLPGEPMRLLPRAEDLEAMRQVLDSLVHFRTAEQRMAIWGVAANLSHRRIAREMRCSRDKAATAVQAILVTLAEDWNRRGTRPDHVDTEWAGALIHRNFK